MLHIDITNGTLNLTKQSLWESKTNYYIVNTAQDVEKYFRPLGYDSFFRKEEKSSF